MTDFTHVLAGFQSAIKGFTNSVSRSPRSTNTTRSLLKYPLNKDEIYGGQITFTSKKVDHNTLSSRYQELIGDDVGKVVGDLGLNLQQLKAFEKNEADKSAIRSSEISKISPNIGNRQCVLYLPNAIQFQDRVSHGEVDLGLLGAGVRAGIMNNQSIGSIAANVGNSVLETGKSLLAGLAGGAISNDETLQVALQRVTSGGLNGAITSASGIALNPNKRSVLQGVGLRNFSFTFSMIPSSPDEARSIEAIVKFFREEMYPEAVQQLGISAAYKYPSIFEIDMKYRTPDGKMKRVGTKILDCFLTSADVNYNPTGMSFHGDGNPQETTLTLNFLEERTLDRYDVAVGGY